MNLQHSGGQLDCSRQPGIQFTPVVLFFVLPILHDWEISRKPSRKAHSMLLKHSRTSKFWIFPVLTPVSLHLDYSEADNSILHEVTIIRSRKFLRNIEESRPFWESARKIHQAHKSGGILPQLGATVTRYLKANAFITNFST